jgi:flagellum-specific peptidoglycan hydrolase FlgJ
MTKEQFIRSYYSLAEKAGKRFNINPTVILAQAANESDWGGSYSARVRKNFFGIIATEQTNEYWDGAKSPSQTNPHLVFRIYKTALNSFMDFARLISTNYKSAATLSPDSTLYAKAIAYSPYLSEQNGDNRLVYQKAITDNSSYIESMMVELKKKRVSIKQVLEEVLPYCFCPLLPITKRKK